MTVQEGIPRKPPGGDQASVGTQEYRRSATGRRIPAHTPQLRSACACRACWATRYWTPARRRARSAQLREQYADGRRVATGEGNRGRVSCWTAEQDDALRSLVGQHDVGTIARTLTARFGYPRSEAAVKHRIGRLGASRMDARPLSTAEVGRLLGVSAETVRARLVRHGYLTGTLRRGGPGPLRFFERAEVERMVREHPEAYDVEKIRDPRLLALALAAGRGRRLLGTREVAALTGVDSRTLAGWCLGGRLPSARFVRGVRPGAGGAWMLEYGDVETVKRLVATRGERARERAESRRCPVTGVYLPAGGERTRP